MSIATQIARLTRLRNRLRDKINALGIDNNNQLDLGDCVTAVESIGGTQDITGTSTVDVAAKQYARVNDANLIPGNIVSGVSILGVTGTASVSPPAASLTTASVLYGGQNVPSTLYPPTGYDGFDRVLVELTDANRTLTAGNIKNGGRIMGGTGSYETPTETQSPSLSDLVTDGITSHSVTITPSQSYRHLSQVTIPQITSAIDDNIAAGNIKNGVSILGVTGTYSPIYFLLRTRSSSDYQNQTDELGRFTTISFTDTTFPGTLPQCIAIYTTQSTSLASGKIINLHKCPLHNNEYVVNYMNTSGEIIGTVLDASTLYITRISNSLMIKIYDESASFTDRNYEGIAIF